MFYEKFEDVCALANNCKGMSARERLLALRGRCRGSRLKTYTNAYRAAWKSGEVLSDPEAVCARIKAKHLVFGESRAEREVDGEHASLTRVTSLSLSSRRVGGGRPRQDAPRALPVLPPEDATASSEGD